MIGSTEQQWSAGGNGSDSFFPPTERPRLRRIMFASQKGGVGKTACAVNIAALLGEAGKRVLIVDTDPNGSIAACFGIRTRPSFPGVFGISDYPLETLCVQNAVRNVDILPYAGDRRPQHLPMLEAAIARLSTAAADTYDFVIVDSRPSAQDMTRRLCQVVDEVVVVFQCQHLAFRTLCGILSELRAAKADGAPARLVGLLLTMLNEADPDQARLATQIRASLGKALLPISIPYDPQVSDCFADRLPVVVAQPASPASVAFRAVVESLLAMPARAGG
jgi:chromosome partitioning protein